MEVRVIRGNVEYITKSEEQLKIFLDAGYKVLDEKEEVITETEKPAKKGRKKQ